jgi:hypothetical protein
MDHQDLERTSNLMIEPIEIENEYFNWLCAKVLDTRVNNYYDLMRILYTTEFVWIVLGDKNRAADGLELRQDFTYEVAHDTEYLWENQPVSVLEVFIAFSYKLEFQTDMPVKQWFWIIMENLLLDQFRQVSASDLPIIEEILDTFIWRTYDPKGYGGMFPLPQTQYDQRKVEIWYQFSEYVIYEGYL